MSAPYPLIFSPILLEKVWGGRRLATLGKQLPPPTKPGAAYGESWEVADLAETSASGAGGGAIRSTIANGPLRTRPLGDAIAAWGAAMLGARTATGFPLLIKFLDASENLSVQVHPSPDYARTHAGAHLKTESWYILAAEPGAVIYKGLKPGVTRSQFERALVGQASSLPKVDRLSEPVSLTDLLISIPAIPGQCHTLPSGTMHALGAGVLVAEVQTPSDTTYRVYDWGRAGRELHLQQSLDCAFKDKSPNSPALFDEATLNRIAPVAALKPGDLCARVASTDFYTIDDLRPLDGDHVSLGYGCRGTKSTSAGTSHALILITISGRGTLQSSDNAFDPMPLSTGSTVLIPASLSASAILHADHSLRTLRVGVL